MPAPFLYWRVEECCSRTRYGSRSFAEKYRSLGIVSGDLIVGDMKGKDALIIDDLISTGTTIARTARACRAQGAARVFAAATHGLFMEGAEEALADGALERIVVTDTVPPFRLEVTCAKPFALQCEEGKVVRCIDDF